MKILNQLIFTSAAIIGLASCQEPSSKPEGGQETIQEETAKQKLVAVTEENFPTVYTDLRMNIISKQAGGTNKIVDIPLPSSDPAKQPVVRMNRDTYYSSIVFDLKDPAFITVPETDQYASIQIVDENHETQPMIYGSGKHEITAKTRFAFVIVRALEDEVRKNIVIEAGNPGTYKPTAWDMVAFKALEEKGNATFLAGYDQSKAFGNKESGQTTYMNFVGAAGGWGGAMVEDNIYQTSAFLDNEGCYEMTFKDPKDAAFWSVTVYNADGYMFNNLANISSNTEPIENDNGTFTVRFGCDGEPNNLPIREGNTTGKFNVLIRHYNPSEMVRNNEPGYNPTNAIIKVD